jgi:Stress responsive A/B Barrel Domain
MNRRFFTKLGLGLASIASIADISTIDSKPKNSKMKNIFIHHVYFWLKNPNNLDDKAKLREGLHLLTQCKSIKEYHIGIPAGTSRDVIDGSYTFSWFTTFKSIEDQEIYQIDPIHDRFRNEYYHLWSKVVVYDSIDDAY